MSPPRPRREVKAGQPGSPAAAATLDLIARARAGDEDALNDLCARYLPRLQRWAHGRLPAAARHALDTHDVVQETLTQVVRRLHDFEPRHEGAFQGYVRQALLNRIRDEARKVQRRAPQEPLERDHAAGDPSPLELAIGQQEVEVYEAALARLGEDDRAAIVGRIELGLPYAELAPLLGKPSAGAANMAVSRALVRLAKEMARGQVR
jgi:RNA polymerase sigma-70 factor (ECF subfamily)